MDAVLGLSVTSTAVGLVLVEGQVADGDAMTGTGVEVATSQDAAEAVRQTEALAAQRGQRVQSIGVTWSDDARTEASLLLKELTESGHNIVPVQLSEATDALARGIAEVVGYHTTAVCVVEPGQLIALVVTPDDGAVQTAVNTSVITEEDLIGWLSAVFARADWEPEALVLVGSAEDLDGIAPVLEEALAVPVFSPAEAQLALARGAALACTPSVDEWWLDDDLAPTRAPVPAEPRPATERLRRAGPALMLAGGLVAFVVSVSAALGMQFVPERPAPTVRPAAEAGPAAPVAPIAPPPPPVAPPPVEEAPATEDPAPEPAPVEEAPATEPAPIESTDPLPVDAAPPPVVDAVPPVLAPPPVPEQQPGLLQRIRDRLAGVRDDQPPVVEPAPPPPPPLP
ncbi:DUF7159 family protein [Mycolicibacterium obuense]|uniref:DUF7159 domain-containing protein n=1 Tax=Mycolicibacterium obuense TaxID=1807 RepID=A0A0J6Z5P8_9MYCO|nr:hypothetical protein [Mycolicibacterium obuense]KMO79941.1 hypothetical protein MOBUDSM44075_01074 [Mycolicibacterium obuense]